MLIQADVMKIRLCHVAEELWIRFKTAHNCHPWLFVIRQALKIIVPYLVVAIWVESILTGVPQVTHRAGRLIKKFNAIQGLSSDGSFRNPFFHDAGKLTQNNDRPVNISVI